MATLTQQELATRILHKLRVLDPRETADADDAVRALEALQEAHFALRGDGLVRWTLNDIPPEVQAAYVMLAAFLCADDYASPVDVSQFWMRGLRMVQTFVHVPLSDPGYVENF